MNNFWIILWHTYFSKLKTKSFIITSLITLVLIIGLTNMTKIIDVFSDDEQGEKVAVIDQSGELFAPFQEQIKSINKDVHLQLYEGSEEEGEKAVKNDEFKGLLVLSQDNEKLPQASFKARSIADSTLPATLQQGLQQIKTQAAATQINLTQEQLGKLYEPVAFSKTALEENAKTEEELNQARGLVYVLLFVIYFAVIMYANMIAMEVATEKSSRVMEILISSVSPIKQMFAKILGIALLSLTQMAAFLLIGYYFVKQNLETMDSGFFEFFGFGDIPVQTIIYAVVFFILGYFLYATLAAFLGSLVSRIEDVQQMITPMTIMIVAGFMIAMVGLGQPETTFITITSYIPFFTPMLMFMRVGMLTLPAWEPLLGIAILLVTIVVLAIFGARVYKGGVLMYGKSNSFKDIKKALQLTKNK
ncbi:ABC transporter permease [Cytobacillus praedii]|uniref:ABC transporter permease n=1 Tax=Cytobacillus praedii TaxID=1742358 RepID=A0A4R1AWV9_9BACI|nr:ABC transporter permease [Cytobacillus praedii]MED3551443.1 ABC transporter permease [Cytobacillus praedii]MED3572496.1 ABC transporter permease [Cytobacillus praedii]TCJ04932.1 ABC transporter permease [Cytobacillus praedii]